MSSLKYNHRLPQLVNLANLVSDWELANQIRNGYYSFHSPLVDNTVPGCNTSLVLNGVTWRNFKGSKKIYYKRISIKDFKDDINVTGTLEQPLSEEPLENETTDQTLLRVLSGYIGLPSTYIRLREVGRESQIRYYKLGFNINKTNELCFVDDGEITVFFRYIEKFNLGELVDDLNGFLIPTYEKERTIFRMDGTNHVSSTVIELLPADRFRIDYQEDKYYESITSITLNNWNIDDGILNNYLSEYSSYPYITLVDFTDTTNIEHVTFSDILIREVSRNLSTEFTSDRSDAKPELLSFSDIIIRDRERTLSTDIDGESLPKLVGISDIIIREISRELNEQIFDNDSGPTFVRMSDIVISDNGLTYSESDQDAAKSNIVNMSDIIIAEE